MIKRTVCVDKANQAFTLIELLVVIAIIALLSAILFPVFAKAREKARQTSCASNEKQIGLAFLQYVEDYDEMFPHGTQVGSCASATTADSPTPGNVRYDFSGGGWDQQLAPYLKTTAVLDCPDDPYQEAGSVSYIYNAVIPVMQAGYDLGACSTWRPQDTGMSGAASKLNSPANTVLIAEGISDSETVGQSGVGRGQSEGAYQGYGNNQSFPDWYTGPIDNCAATVSNTTCADLNFYNGTPSARNGTAMPGIHTEGSNWLACDGHVKWLKGTSVSAGWAATLPTNGSSPFSGVKNFLFRDLGLAV